MTDTTNRLFLATPLSFCRVFYNMDFFWLAVLFLSRHLFAYIYYVVRMSILFQLEQGTCVGQTVLTSFDG